MEKENDAVTTKVAKKSASAKPTERKFKLAKLRENCVRLFSISTSTFDGAMYGVKEEELTVAEAQARIKTWLGGKE